MTRRGHRHGGLFSHNPTFHRDTDTMHALYGVENVRRKIILFEAIWTLEERRNRQDLIDVFKMCNGLSRLKLNEFFTLAGNTRGIRGHSRQLVKFRCTRYCCEYFFKQSD